MSCAYAKRKWPGHEKPYQVCLNPNVRKCKCFPIDEEECPFRPGSWLRSTVEEKMKAQPKPEPQMQQADFLGEIG